MIAWMTLVPAAALALGALLGWRAPARLEPRRPAMAIACAIAALGAAVAIWAAQAATGATPFVRVLSPWTSAVFDGEPALDVDPLAALGLVLVCLSACVGVVRAAVAPALRDSVGRMLGVSAAAALFVAATRAPLGLVSAWLLVDLALHVGTRQTRRALLASHFGLLLVIAGVLALPAEAPIAGAALPSGLARGLLVAAGTIRMGLYPWWWPVPRTPADRLWQAALVRIPVTVAGAFLVIHAGRSPDALAGGPALAALAPALVALACGAFLAWLSRDVAGMLDWTTVAYGGLIALAAGLGSAVGQAVAVILAIDLGLGRAALYAVQGLGTAPGATAAWLLATASLVGLPPSLGFVGRWVLYRELLDLGRPAVVAVAVAATGLIVARWKDARPGGDPSAGGGRHAWLFAAIAGVAWLGGLALRHAQPWLTDATGAALAPHYAADAGVIGGALALPVILGLGLRSLHAGAPGAWSERQQALVQVLRLTDIFDAVRDGVIRTGRLVHDALGFTEGRRTMAWTLVTALAIGAAMLPARLPDLPGQPTAIPTADGALTAAFATASAAAAVMLLWPAPLATLGAIAVGYAVVASVLIASPSADAAGMPTVAVIKILAGGVSVAILAISVLQSAAVDTSRRARIHRLQVSDGGRIAPPLPALTLMAALVLITGIRSATLPEVLPESILRVALTLIAGGCLTVVFARSPLRIAGGVLLALTGAELVYARLESGLLITGGLALFQLLVAIVAAAFVGENARPAAGP